MSEVPKVVAIVGANLAGGTVAWRLREEGYDGRIVLIGEETLPPYERPSLSKEYLRGQEDELHFMRPPEWWDEGRIETYFGTRAESLDTGKPVRLASTLDVPPERPPRAMMQLAVAIAQEFFDHRGRHADRYQPDPTPPRPDGRRRSVLS